MHQLPPLIPLPTPPKTRHTYPYNISLTSQLATTTLATYQLYHKDCLQLSIYIHFHETSSHRNT